MSLQKRLTSFTLMVVVVASGSIGLFQIQTAFREQLNQVSSELRSISETIDGTQVDKLTVALALTSASQSDISLFLIEENGGLIPLAFDEDNDAQLNKVKSSISKRPIFETQEVISRQVRIEGGLKLALLAFIGHIYDERSSDLLRFVLYLLIASLGALLALRKVINKDVERESQELKLRERLHFEESRRKILLEFATDTSHELRTPLTVITGYLDLIRKSKSASVERDVIATMQKEASRLEANIANLLTMLELEVIEDESLSPINLSRLIEGEMKSFREIESNRELIVNIESNLWIKGSEELVLKLLRNALGNIRRHSKIDAPVRVILKRQVGFAELFIEDGGPLDATQSLEIEDYLTRFSSNRSISKGGSGLGFSIMNKSASKLSGKLSLFKSELGGFGINIKIPLLNSTSAQA
jgi:K+-sensing histidine kinase KdpD